MANNIPNLQFNQTAAPPTYGQSAQFNPSFGNLYQPQSIFMQPIGNIYGLNSSAEVGNMPVGAGVSVGLCLAEGTMYMKTMQNNSPVILGYKLHPMESQNTASAPSASKTTQTSKVEEVLSQLSEKILALEKKVEALQPKTGGKTEWQM